MGKHQQKIKLLLSLGALIMMVAFATRIESAGPVCEAPAPTKGNKMSERPSLNVLGQPLAPCCMDPLTGFYRDGSCRTGASDHGTHVICATMTEEFLRYTKSQGNDLQTPAPQYRFPGLKAGDKWCLCALRWRQAHEAGVAPPVHLESTHERALDYVPLETLKRYVQEQAP